MKKAIAVAAAVIFLAFLLPPLSELPDVEALFGTLTLGWSEFLKRSFAGMNFNPAFIASGVVLSALIVLVGHWLLRSLFGNSHFGHAGGAWRWRWTLCLYASIWLVFAVTFAAAGLFRQTTWLMHEPHPWFKFRWASYRQLENADNAVRDLLLKTKNDCDATQTRLAATHLPGSPGLLIDEFDVLLFGPSSNDLPSYIIVSRQQKPRPFLVRLSSEHIEFRPIRELESTVAVLSATNPGR